MATEQYTTDQLGDLINTAGNASTLEDKQRQLALQLQLSNQLRQGKAADHGTMAGTIYIPPNPVNQALEMYNQVQGIQNSKKQTDSLAGINQQKVDAETRLLRLKYGLDPNTGQDTPQAPPAWGGGSDPTGGAGG